MTEYERFKSNIIINEEPDGRCEISCKKGLWSVSANGLLTAIHEALHYYVQYKNDGEYDELLKKNQS